MNAGMMDYQITIDQYSLSTDSNTGEKLQSWTTYATPWAHIEESPSGSESVNADRRERKQTTVFTLRYDSGIDTKMRIQFDSNYYNIVNIANRERNLYLTIEGELSK